MYEFILSIHSIFRWVVLLTAVWAVIRFVTGWLARRSFTAGDDAARKYFTISLDVQFLLGLILMFVSPIIASLFADFGAGMKDETVRFFGMEHTLLMLVALTLAHIGGAMVRKAPDDAGKLKKGAIFFTLSLIAMLAGIPWVMRPLARLQF